MESLMELAIYFFGPYLELFTLAILSLVIIFFIIITVIFRKSPRKHIYYATLNLALIAFVLFETIYCRSVTAYANYILLRNNYEENNTIKRNIDRIKQLQGANESQYQENWSLRNDLNELRQINISNTEKKQLEDKPCSHIELESQINHLNYVLAETFKGVGKDTIEYYIGKLKDPEYTGTYGDGYTWHYAAEELGIIGKEAIPKLIELLDTKNDFERTQALYALRLASQCGNVQSFTAGEYVKGNSEAFPDPEDHPKIVEAWKIWYNKHKHNF